MKASEAFMSRFQSNRGSRFYSNRPAKYADLLRNINALEKNNPSYPPLYPPSQTFPTIPSAWWSASSAALPSSNSARERLAQRYDRDFT
jgi:hypothetical protein